MDLQVLIREAGAGSASAQKCLFDHFAGAMLLVCSRYLKSRQDAEEVMLDGFFKFFTNLRSFVYQGEAPARSFLKKIMINECLMFLRKKNLFVLVTDEQPNEAIAGDDALDQLSVSEIFSMIIRLPPGYRTVFNLYEVEGMSHREIGALLSISEGTSKSQLSKAKALLQKMIINNKEYVARKTT